MDVSIALAFAAGLLSFVSPCVLALVPVYLAFLGESAAIAAPAPMTGSWRGPVLSQALLFVAGFTFVFVLLGTSVGLFGSFLFRIDGARQVAGVAVIGIGLLTTGIFGPVLERVMGIGVRADLLPATRSARAVGLGALVAIGWTPCIGPVLGAILAVAAGEDSVRQGVSLLFVYSLGLGIPFVIAAIAIRPFLSTMQRFKRHLATVEKVLGGFLVLTGILFLTDAMTLISSWMLELFPGLATIG